MTSEYLAGASKDGDRVSEPVADGSEIERRGAKIEPISLEEIRRQARENWLQHRQQDVGVSKELGYSKAADRSGKENQGHALDDGLDD